MQHNDTQVVARVFFRSYCNTFRDFQSGEDEKRVECQQWWKCTEAQYRCQTGQCISHEWLTDTEWDCTDASDEEDWLKRITTWIRNQATIHPSTDELTWASDTCHSESTFVCLSRHSAQPQLICLNRSQLSDDTIDCLGAIDERNTLPHCSQPSSLLGYHFFCPSTNHCIPFYGHCRDINRCPNRTDDDHWCSRSMTKSSCDGERGFVCFNGICISNGRCDWAFDCPFGEDEYMCDYLAFSIRQKYSYRAFKEHQARRITQTIRLPVFPAGLITADTTANEIILRSPVIQTALSSPSMLTPYWCNRGLGILSSNGSIVCFCPPQYYGHFCEYHADRVLVLLHLNLSQSIYTPRTDPTIVIKLLVLFLFDDQVLMTHEFHVRPAWEIATFARKMTHFPYSRSARFRQHRQDRYMNRTDIIHAHPYSIRIEAYDMDVNERPSLEAVWQYPIAFDYLPVFRFAKVLHWTTMEGWKEDPCSNHQCPQNAECHPLMNNRSHFICLCKSDFIGENCAVRDEQCAAGYCTRPSLCKPNYRSVLHGNDASPYCVCPSNRYGDRCDIIHDMCQLTPCLHGGSCYPASQPDRMTCICTEKYRGSRCETMKPQVHLSLTDSVPYAGAVVQYFRIDPFILTLLLDHQQAYKLLPRSIEYHHDRSTAPPIIVTKTYPSHHGSSSDLYLLSVALNPSLINSTTEMSDANRCEPVHTIANGDCLHF